MFQISNKLIAVFVIAFIVFQGYSITSNIILGFKMKKEKEEESFLEQEHLTAGVVSTGIVHFGIIPACTITLKQGWNFISICANSSNRSVKGLLGDINGDYEYVYEWNNSAQKFKVYSVYSSLKPFTEFNENKSYFIHFKKSSGDFSVIGNEFDDMNVTVGYKWDTPSYPYQFTGNITKYLNTISGQYDYLFKWDVSAQEYIVWSRFSSNRPFNTIGKGEGQFIYITNTSGTVIRYNKSYLRSS